MGGLGNQMFQYATATRLAQSHNTEVKIDLSWFSTKPATPRTYTLNYLKIKEIIATDEEMERFPKMPESKFQKFFLRICSYVKKPAPYGLVTESRLAFNPEVLSLPNNVALVGYWQSYKYFNDIRDILLEEFQPKKSCSYENVVWHDLIKATSSVGLHVRRGDYITHRSIRKIHGHCPIEYYKKSIEYISERVKDPHFFIFSDDIEWVKKNLRTPQMASYITSNRPQKGWLDMMLMSQCKHNIIANSSFSWWAAWLNQNIDKIVIGPAIYYAKKSLNKYTADMFPPEWIRL
jgi:hypothetical protein